MKLEFSCNYSEGKQTDWESRLPLICYDILDADGKVVANGQTRFTAVQNQGSIRLVPYNEGENIIFIAEYPCEIAAFRIHHMTYPTTIKFYPIRLDPKDSINFTPHINLE